MICKSFEVNGLRDIVNYTANPGFHLEIRTHVVVCSSEIISEERE